VDIATLNLIAALIGGAGALVAAVYAGLSWHHTRNETKRRAEELIEVRTKRIGPRALDVRVAYRGVDFEHDRIEAAVRVVSPARVRVMLYDAFHEVTGEARVDRPEEQFDFAYASAFSSVGAKLARHSRVKIHREARAEVITDADRGTHLVIIGPRPLSEVTAEIELRAAASRRRLYRQRLRLTT
jgi:hypothetical protein